MDLKVGLHPGARRAGLDAALDHLPDDLQLVPEVAARALLNRGDLQAVGAAREAGLDDQEDPHADDRRDDQGIPDPTPRPGTRGLRYACVVGLFQGQPPVTLIVWYTRLPPPSTSKS